MKTQHLSSNTKRVISNREREILILIIKEYSTKEIAHLLHVSYETVNSHRKNMMKKLSVRNTAGMVRVAFQRQLVPIPFVMAS
jgi:DNA-binding CsgD family transcriptional regulator